MSFWIQPQNSSPAESLAVRSLWHIGSHYNVALQVLHNLATCFSKDGSTNKQTKNTEHILYVVLVL